MVLILSFWLRTQNKMNQHVTRGSRVLSSEAGRGDGAPGGGRDGVGRGRPWMGGPGRTPGTGADSGVMPRTGVGAAGPRGPWGGVPRSYGAGEPCEGFTTGVTPVAVITLKKRASPFAA